MKQITLLFLLFCLPKLMAQQTTVASGGNATGSGGTVSYSIGQIGYKTQTGTNGIVTQGVQQPFEIVTLSGEEYTTITLEAVVYPNPTSENVTLKILNFSLDNLNYQLFDIRGRLLSESKILNQESVVDMEKYPTATYLLKVISNIKELKTFKIIKN